MRILTLLEGLRSLELRAWRLNQFNLPISQSLDLPILLLLPVILFFLLSACSNSAAAEPAPPEIYYGEDVCEFCGMIVSEERFAAGYLSVDGQEHIFDDIGDMVQSYLEYNGEITALFVHDHDDHTWIKAESAHYVLSDNLPTPMLSGLAAFAAAERAEAFAADLGGQILTFDELLTYYRENPPTPVFGGTSG